MRQRDVVVTFSYRRRDGESSLRRVKATSMSWLTADDGAIVLRAFDVDRDDWRSFLLTGIINALAIEEPEVPDPAEAEEPEDAPPF